MAINSNSGIMRIWQATR